VEVEVFGDWIEAEVAREPLFDPKAERVRGLPATNPVS
jgi:glycine cleavage system aminomethyltransferase T